MRMWLCSWITTVEFPIKRGNNPVNTNWYLHVSVLYTWNNHHVRKKWRFSYLNYVFLLLDRLLTPPILSFVLFWPLIFKWQSEARALRRSSRVQQCNLSSSLCRCLCENTEMYITSTRSGWVRRGGEPQARGSILEGLLAPTNLLLTSPQRFPWSLSPTHSHQKTH